MAGCRQGCVINGGGNGRSLHILSLNMLHEYPSFTYLPQRLDLIAAEIQRLGIDIALLQKIPNSRQNGNGADYLARRTGPPSLAGRAVWLT